MKSTRHLLVVLSVLPVWTAAFSRDLAAGEPRVIRESVTFDAPRLEEPLLIDADDIVVDGGGCEIVGGGETGKLESFRGFGIRAEGRRGVTLRNFKVRGFLTGLRLVDCSDWTIEDCDFSDNYHDPDFGWGWLRTGVSANQALVVVGESLYGISCSRLGNFGGAVTRVDLTRPPTIEDRTMLRLEGANGDWLGPPSSFTAQGDVIYGIKNDWVSPRPTSARGDRLFRWRPAGFRPSRLVSGWFDDPGGWDARETPAEDLGPLPFEIGGGASLVLLPAGWGAGIGDRGGALVVAGCSPSNQDGIGPSSARFGLHDFESGRWRVGKLPGETGSGTSAAFHDGKVFIKRGGMSLGAANAELWTVEPPSAEEFSREVESARTRRFDPSAVEALTIQLDSGGRRPFTVWIDGLRFE